MWRYLVVRTLEVTWSPWGRSHRFGVSGSGVPQPVLLEEAVDDLLAALASRPWRQARTAQLAASLRANLEGRLGRPAYVGDLKACGAWLESLPGSDRRRGAELLRALGAPPPLGWSVEPQGAEGAAAS
jgi:hypothetical protein